jgi:GAF domain-containing protein
MVRGQASLWFWRALWGFLLLAGVGLLVLHASLPADGATGDLESFTPAGFRVQWLLEAREGGLQVDDVIVRAGGHTPEEWLRGAVPGPEWRSGGVVAYEILRQGEPATLDIPLGPISLGALLQRWAPQFLTSLAILAVGSFVFWKRPQDPGSRLLMLFCMTTGIHYWIDAYNVQFTLLPGTWRFWLHLAAEHGTFALTYAAICNFVLIFPTVFPWIRRFPRAFPVALYVVNPLAIGLTMALSPTWSAALKYGNTASFIVVVAQMVLTLAAGVRSLRVAIDPVARAQIRWIFWGAGLALAVGLPGYLIPMAVFGRPFIPHPLVMLLPAAVPYIYAIAILRYRLFDIEFIINRTLVYGTLVLVLGGVYLGLVRLLAWMIQSTLRWQDETAVAFIATLVVVLAFTRLRRRVQRLVDRAFYRDKVDMLRIVAEIGGRLPTTMVPRDLDALLTQELPSRLRIVYASLAVLDPRGDCFAALSGAGGDVVLPVDHPLPRYLRRTGNPLLRLQPPPDLPPEAQHYLDGHQIELSIPLVVGGRLVALYHLAAKRSGRVYDRDEVRVLSSLGAQAAVAVEHSRLIQAAERQAQELALLHDGAVAVSSSLQMEEVLSAIASQLGQALQASSVYICSWDEVTAASTVLAQWLQPGIDLGESDLGQTYDLRDYPATIQALTERRSLVLLATDPDLDPRDREEAERYGWRSHLIVPFVSQGVVIGYAEIWETRWERHFTEAEVRISQTLAADAAVAIERARLFEAEKRQRELAEALQEAAATVSSTLDLVEVLDRILEQTTRVVCGDACNIMLIEGEYSQVVRWLGYERLGVAGDVANMSLKTAQYPSLAQMLQSGEPWVVSDTAADSQWFNLQGWEWLRSYVGVPIRVAGRTVGFLNVDGSRPGQFTEAEGRQLQTFADHAATAIQNARLFDEALRRTTCLEAQNAVVAAAAVASDLPELLRVTLEHIMRGLGLGMGYIWVQDQYAVRGLPQELGQAIAWLARPPGEEGAGPAVVDDWQQVAPGGVLSAILPTVVGYGIRSTLAVPIWKGDEAIGSLALASSLRRPWSTEDIALLETIGRQVGGAAERLFLLAKTHEQAQQVQQIIRTVPEGMLLLSADHDVLLANPTAEEYLAVLAEPRSGGRLQQLGGKRLADLLVLPSSGIRYEVTVEASVPRVFEVLAQPLETDPAVGGWVLLIRDVTREREAQAQIQQQNRLAALGQLAGGIAHDFNNILTIINFGAEMSLCESGLSPGVSQDLQSILAAGRKGAQLVRQILDFSRRAWLDTRPVDLHAVVREITAILQRTLPENVAVIVEAEPGDYTVAADPTRIQQALMNLALNARDAMPQGGQLRIVLSNVHVCAAEEAPAADMPPGDWVCLAVADTGTGIGHQVLAHLYEPFFTTKPMGEGTGLGLAQVYGIVKQHWGYIAVDTVPGQGTTFRVYLPVRSAAGEGETKPETPDQALPQGGGETILLVEDDDEIRSYCRETLGSLGYRVLVAGNGQEALEIYRAQAPVDLLLTDLVMPEMGGQELIGILRKVTPELKAVVLTGYTVADLGELRAQGVSEVLQKPLTVHVLAQVVRHALDA